MDYGGQLLNLFGLMQADSCMGKSFKLNRVEYKDFMGKYGTACATNKLKKSNQDLELCIYFKVKHEWQNKQDPNKTTAFDLNTSYKNKALVTEGTKKLKSCGIALGKVPRKSKSFQKRSPTEPSTNQQTDPEKKKELKK